MIIALMLLGLWWTNQGGSTSKNISYDEFQQYVRNGYVSKVIGYDDNSVEFYVKPNLQLSYHLQKLKLNLSIGYLIDFKAPFHLESKKNAKLLDPSSGKEVKTNWNGLHFGLNVYYTLFFNKSGR